MSCGKQLSTPQQQFNSFAFAEYYLVQNDEGFLLKTKRSSISIEIVTTLKSHNILFGSGKLYHSVKRFTIYKHNTNDLFINIK